MTEYDLLILGRGAAAFSAAVRASEITSNEARIAMIGDGPIGGTCVNLGCVPSKYLIEASERVYAPEHQKMIGISKVKVEYNFPELMEGLRNYVSEARKSKYENVIASYPNVEVIDGTATLLGQKMVQVNNQINGSMQLSGANILIATGSSPSVPEIDGLKGAGFITSDTMWSLKKLPQSIVIIGSGAIGLELGQALMRLGSNVAVVEVMDSLLPQSEPEIGIILQKVLNREGMNFFLHSKVISVDIKNGKKTLKIVTKNGKEEIFADEILVAAGRTPNTSGLNLSAAGIKVDQRGGIITDRTMRTSAPGIYAAGDCVSKTMLLETLAAREGAIAAANMFGQEGEVDYGSTAWAVFTSPQVAGVGLTERGCTMKYGACSCRAFSLSNLTRATINRDEDGLIKVIAEPNTGKVVGIHVISPNAIDIIAEGAHAVRNGLTYRDIMETSHIFPSYSEAIKLAAQSFIRDISKMPCCVE
ncbi:MAG: mercury(II) reductase [Conexivisphaerales archaeon]